MSREQLAADAGLSPRTIYAIEVEGVRPQRATRRVLAMALDIDFRDIIPSRNDHDPGTNRAVEKEGDQAARARTPTQLKRIEDRLAMLEWHPKIYGDLTDEWIAELSLAPGFDRDDLLKKLRAGRRDLGQLIKRIESAGGLEP